MDVRMLNLHYSPFPHGGTAGLPNDSFSPWREKVRMRGLNKSCIQMLTLTSILSHHKGEEERQNTSGYRAACGAEVHFSLKDKISQCHI